MKTVLVVDDDNDIRLSLELLLRGKGFKLEFAKNGHEAMEFLAGHAMPDLILLDMAMPVMDGWAFVKAFESKFDHRPKLVVMTAATDAEARAEEVKADGVLSKPYSMTSLLEVLHRHLHNHRR